MAITGQSASPTEMSPDPDDRRASDPLSSATDTSPEPVEATRSRARPTLMSPDPLTIRDRPMSALTEMSADPTLITYSRSGGTPSRRWALVLRKVLGGKLIRRASRSWRTCTALRNSS